VRARGDGRSARDDNLCSTVLATDEHSAACGGDTDVDMLHADVTQEVLSAFHQVHREPGTGYLESVYEAAMTIALEERGLAVERLAALAVFFHGRCVGEFRADLIVEGRVLVELKPCRTLLPTHEAQLINYLRSSTIEVGLVINFGARPEFRRLRFTADRKAPRVGPRSGPPCSSVANTVKSRPPGG
jgi:GxxExxY protein